MCTPANFTPRHGPAERAGNHRLVEGAGEQERAALDLHAAHAQAFAGRATQVLLEKEGLRVGVLRSDDASPREREEYICKVGRDVDVMISHPQLVATGLDLFNFTRGKHNFNNLSFYQTGYNLFTIRQASRRGYRIGQPLDCTVRYFYYAATMQAIAMNLMSRKAMAAMRLEEGSVSEEGLAAMGGGSDQLALVNAISEVIDPADIQRNWGRVKSGQRGEKKRSRSSSCPRPSSAKRATIGRAESFLSPNLTISTSRWATRPTKSSEVEVPEREDAELSEDDLDFDEDDLQEMFANLGKGRRGRRHGLLAVLGLQYALPDHERQEFRHGLRRTEHLGRNSTGLRAAKRRRRGRRSSSRVKIVANGYDVDCAEVNTSIPIASGSQCVYVCEVGDPPAPAICEADCD